MRPELVRRLAGACLVVCLALVLHGLVLGLHFEATPRALADAAKGKAVGYPAAAGALAAVVALVAADRGWAKTALALGGALTAGSLVMELVL